MYTLPMQPDEATQIGATCLCFAIMDGQMVYFSNLRPIDCHDVSDRPAMLLRIARFATLDVRSRDLQRAFGVSRQTVQRAKDKLLEHGEASFSEPRRGRGPSVIDAAMAQRASDLLSEGKSMRSVARELGVASATLHYNLRKGFVVDTRPNASRSSSPAAAERQGPADDTIGDLFDDSVGDARPDVQNPTTPEIEETAVQAVEPLVDRGTREHRDRAAPMGRGARDCVGRIAASTGAMGEVRPGFDEPLSAVSRGGVLAALPMLLKERLLDRTGEFLSLPKGYYGLTSIILFLAFLFMARVRNAEALRHLAPGEWGAILGLDRCPEVKTLRRKVRALARDEGHVRGWQNALATDWLSASPEACATLSVDGHVKVYSGRKGRLAKHFVARQKLCLPATTAYWVNELGGRPLLCLHKDLDPKMTRALEEDILPALERLGLPGADAPDLTADTAAAPALTLVFDREGWSPALFGRLARRGIAVITWQKNFKDNAWPESDFSLVDVTLHSPAATRTIKVRLAEKRIRLSGGTEVRQIRRLLDCGRQMPLVTTDFHMPMEQAASALFSRWAQENFFKYMRQEFNLDSLPVHDLVAPDAEAEVVNPVWRELNHNIHRLQRDLSKLRNRMAALGKGKSSKKTVEDVRQLQARVDTIDAEREALKCQRKATKKRVKVTELPEDQKLDALPNSEKLLLDIIRMIAYRAETRMTYAVADAQGSKQRPRRPLAALFQSDADIIPDPVKGVLRVRILGTASNAGDTAITGLLEELNETRTVFPGTDLRMVYELPGNGEKQ